MKLLTFVKLSTICYCWTSLIPLVISENVLEAIAKRRELEKFNEWIRQDEVMKVFLEQRRATVFAPRNEAIEKYKERTSVKDVSKIVSLHVVGLEVQKELFPETVSSRLQEAPPLYLGVKTRPPPTNDAYWYENPKKDYFVNNALILEKLDFINKNDEKQVLYIIDQVIDLWTSTTPLPPPALELIKTPGIYGLDENLGPFYNRITGNNQGPLFERAGNHTFFVPVGEVTRVGSKFDNYVVRGHVIPNNVLFLRVIGKDHYHSASFDNTVNVELSLLNRTVRLDTEQSYFIQSNTIKSDSNHNKGVVMSRIVRPNIPVKNGVVHLIEKPLMIVDMTIMDFINMERDGRLSIFSKLIEQSSDVRAEMSRMDQKTILAPVNSAFNNIIENVTYNTLSPADRENEVIKILTNDPGKLKDLLYLHIVSQSISTDDVRTKPEASSFDGKRNLYFRLVGDDKSRKLTVEGGGVNATTIQADIGATNGIIHIIDRVLGMPFQNLYDKLKSDQEVTFSYRLGEQGIRWNEQLGQEDRRYTFFVPSDKAWEEFKTNYPSEYKQLNEGIFPSIARKILDRHLIGNRQLSSLELENQVHTINGEFKIKKSFGVITLEWEGKTARITRPDVQAINGVIHVIDNVMALQRDFNVNGSISSQLVNVGLLILTLLMTKLFY